MGLWVVLYILLSFILIVAVFCYHIEWKDFINMTQRISVVGHVYLHSLKDFSVNIFWIFIVSAMRTFWKHYIDLIKAWYSSNQNKSMRFTWIPMYIN